MYAQCSKMQNPTRSEGEKNIHLCPLCTIVSILSSVFQLVLKQTKPPNIKSLTYLLPQHQERIWILHPAAAIGDSSYTSSRALLTSLGRITISSSQFCLLLNKHRKLQSPANGKQDGCSLKTFIALKKRLTNICCNQTTTKQKVERKQENRDFPHKTDSK